MSQKQVTLLRGLKKPVGCNVGGHFRNSRAPVADVAERNSVQDCRLLDLEGCVGLLLPQFGQAVLTHEVYYGFLIFKFIINVALIP